jgi:hypothetical protein
LLAAVATGNELTVTTTELLAVEGVASVTVTVYVVVVVGDTTGLAADDVNPAGEEAHE